MRIAIHLLLALLPAANAVAELPLALAIPDDLGNRVLLFDPNTGAYRDALPLIVGAELDGPFVAALGPPVTVDKVLIPNTLLVGDQRLRRIALFNADDGTFVRTFASNLDPRGLTYLPSGNLLVAGGRAGVLEYKPDGTLLATRISPSHRTGPLQTWDVLYRATGDGGAPDLLVTDVTLDAILRFKPDGTYLGVFAQLPQFMFLEQLAQRASGNVLVADNFANAIFEFAPTGALLRTFAVARPRGVAELADNQLLVSGEAGVQVFDPAGALVTTVLPGYPTSAPRYIRALRCAESGRLGDLNGDGVVDAFDIGPFVMALANPDEFPTSFPAVNRECVADANRDGTVDVFDIEAFIDLLIG